MDNHYSDTKTLLWNQDDLSRIQHHRTIIVVVVYVTVTTLCSNLIYSIDSKTIIPTVFMPSPIILWFTWESILSCLFAKTYGYLSAVGSIISKAWCGLKHNAHNETSFINIRWMEIPSKCINFIHFQHIHSSLWPLSLSFASMPSYLTDLCIYHWNVTKLWQLNQIDYNAQSTKYSFLLCLFVFWQIMHHKLWIKSELLVNLWIEEYSIIDIYRELWPRIIDSTLIWLF